MRVKLLRSIAPYQTASDPRKKNKRINVKGLHEAGEVLDMSREDADMYIAGENALPVDKNGDITEAGFELLGVEDFEDVGAPHRDSPTPAYGRWFKLTSTEKERWDRVARKRSGQDQEVKAQRGRRRKDAEAEITQMEG